VKSGGGLQKKTGGTGQESLRNQRPVREVTPFLGEALWQAADVFGDFNARPRKRQMGPKKMTQQTSVVLEANKFLRNRTFMHF